MTDLQHAIDLRHVWLCPEASLEMIRADRIVSLEAEAQHTTSTGYVTRQREVTLCAVVDLGDEGRRVRLAVTSGAQAARCLTELAGTLSAVISNRMPTVFVYPVRDPDSSDLRWRGEAELPTGWPSH